MQGQEQRFLSILGDSWLQVLKANCKYHTAGVKYFRLLPGLYFCTVCALSEGKSCHTGFIFGRQSHMLKSLSMFLTRHTQACVQMKADGSYYLLCSLILEREKMLTWRKSNGTMHMCTQTPAHLSAPTSCTHYLSCDTHVI